MSSQFSNLASNYHEQLLKNIFSQIQNSPKDFENSLNDYKLSLKLFKS
jgi:hypothetical protein